MASNGIMARQSLHRIWIAGKKNVSEMGPWVQVGFIGDNLILIHLRRNPSKIFKPYKIPLLMNYGLLFIYQIQIRIQIPIGNHF